MISNFRLILLCFLFAITGKVTAQGEVVEYHLIVTHQSAPGACDGSIEIQCMNCLPGVNYTWYDYDSLAIPIGTGTLITGLCGGNYIVATNNCTLLAFFTGINDVTTSGSSFQVNYILHYEDLSGDAFVEAEFIGGFPPYSTTTWDNYTGLVVDSQSNLSTLNGIVTDSLYQNGDDYTTDVIDSVYNYVDMWFDVMYSGPCNTGPSALYLEAQGFPVSDSLLCDGTALATAYGGTPPYTYSFSTGSITSTETGLCPGSYLVSVTDGNADTYTTTFVVGYPGTMFFNDPYSLTYLDTLYAEAVQDCGLDFSLPIDTFYVDTSYSISPLITVAEWIIEQDTNTFLFIETYYVPDTTDNYLFGLGIYCAARSGNFGSFSLFYGVPGSNWSGINSFETSGIFISELYPNPANDNCSIVIQSSSEENLRLEIISMDGKIILNNPIVIRTGENRIEVSLKELPIGIYTISFLDETGSRVTKRIIKN
jgi:hypothetical protein